MTAIVLLFMFLLMMIHNSAAKLLRKRELRAYSYE